MNAAEIIIGWRSALIFAVCLPIFIAAIILCLRKRERQANIYLALALTAGAWSMGPQIIGFANGYTVWPGLTFFPFNSELLIPPLIYFHAHKLMTDKPLAWRKILLMPGLLALLYYLIAFLFLGDYENKWDYSRTVNTPYILPVIFLLTFAITIICAVLTISLIRRYRIFLRETESAARDFDPLWLLWAFGLLGIAGITWMSLGVLSFLNPDMSYVAAYPFQLAVMVIFAILGFASISRITETFPKIASQKVTEPTQQDSKSSPERDWIAEGQTLRRTVLDKEWYLEPRLSIRDVASRMGTNETYISRALNLGVGQSFNQFINEMRVVHAKALIKTNTGNFLSIAMDSGFNSKATFNRVFRDVSGETPSRFKSRSSQNVS